MADLLKINLTIHAADLPGLCNFTPAGTSSQWLSIFWGVLDAVGDKLIDGRNC